MIVKNPKNSITNEMRSIRNSELNNESKLEMNSDSLEIVYFMRSELDRRLKHADKKKKIKAKENEKDNPMPSILLPSMYNIKATQAEIIIPDTVSDILHIARIRSLFLSIVEIKSSFVTNLSFDTSRIILTVIVYSFLNN